MKAVHKAFIGIMVVTILVVVAILAWSIFRPYPEPRLKEPLAEVLPTGEGYGWEYEDLPLGNTESLDDKAHEILRLTDFVYRRYTKGNESFEVYIAYWAPGVMPPRLMNGHTPDSCWVGNGWVKKDAKLIPFADRTQKGNWRWFDANSKRINVIYWHLLGGKTYQFDFTAGLTRVKQILSAPFTYGADLRSEQFLIRISSITPLSDLEELSLMETIIEALCFSGLSDCST